MIPDSISTNNSLTIREPIKLEIALEQNTMVFGGLVVAVLAVAAVKIFK